MFVKKVPLVSSKRIWDIEHQKRTITIVPRLKRTTEQNTRGFTSVTEKCPYIDNRPGVVQTATV